MNCELQKALDNLDGEIERIRAFAENLAVTEDYKMDIYDSELRGWDKLSIDASEISKDLLELVETAHDKYLELSRMIDQIEEHKED